MEFWALAAIAYLICGASRLIGDFSGDVRVNPAYVRLGFGNRYTLMAMLLWWKRLPPFVGFAYLAWTLVILAPVDLGLYFLVPEQGFRLAILLAIPALLTVIAAFRGAHAAARDNQPSK